MTDVIHRDPNGATDQAFDLIVVGGGIYGIMVALEATRRRLRPLLLERDDFAGATSHNSLRILHGGLRYLQTMDLVRAFESIRERAWWLTNFPELVEPLPCLMPLYGEALRRPDAMRAALLCNDLMRRCAGGEADQRLPNGRILRPEAVAHAYPAVDREGLMGGALWHDLWSPAAPRLCIEALRWACQRGAVALNYVEALRPVVVEGAVQGVEAVDRVSQQPLVFQAPVVVAAAGPWALSFARQGRVAVAESPLLAWNVLFDVPAPSPSHALALKAKRADAQTFFLVPHLGRLLAGTAYRSTGGPILPDRAARQRFIGALNEAAPALRLDEERVLRLYPGRLIAATDAPGQPADRPRVIDFAEVGGPKGLYALQGVKLTIARAVADRLLRHALPRVRPLPLKAFRRDRRAFPPDERLMREWLHGHQLALFKRIAAEEAALHLDDLLLRRSPFGDRPREALLVAPAVCGALGWDEAHSRDEIARLRSALSLPARPVPAWLNGSGGRRAHAAA